MSTFNPPKMLTLPDVLTGEQHFWPATSQVAHSHAVGAVDAFRGVARVCGALAWVQTP